jgi:anti-sigma regulatory factor (Ser/Thr protein kinase)
MSGHADAVHRTTQARSCSSELRSGVGVAHPHTAPGFMPLDHAGWPLASYLELGALPTAVGCARGHTRALLAEWGLARHEDLAEDIELLVSELLTNAYQTTVNRGLDTPIRWRLSSDHAQVLIEVWDGDVTPPPAPSTTLPSTDTESGRGLFLVHMLAARWSWYPVRHQPGKVIWAEVGP